MIEFEKPNVDVLNEHTDLAQPRRTLTEYGFDESDESTVTTGSSASDEKSPNKHDSFNLSNESFDPETKMIHDDESDDETIFSDRSSKKEQNLYDSDSIDFVTPKFVIFDALI